MKKQSLTQAVAQARAGRLLGITSLEGCPVGGWGETGQAIRQMCEALPHRSKRSYTVDELITQLYTTDQADRYRWREVQS